MTRFPALLCDFRVRANWEQSRQGSFRYGLRATFPFMAIPRSAATAGLPALIWRARNCRCWRRPTSASSATPGRIVLPDRRARFWLATAPLALFGDGDDHAGPRAYYYLFCPLWRACWIPCASADSALRGAMRRVVGWLHLVIPSTSAIGNASTAALSRSFSSKMAHFNDGVLMREIHLTSAQTGRPARFFDVTPIQVLRTRRHCPIRQFRLPFRLPCPQTAFSRALACSLDGQAPRPRVDRRSAAANAIDANVTALGL